MHNNSRLELSYRKVDEVGYKTIFKLLTQPTNPYIDQITFEPIH
jgi:hypothetical protein